MRLVKPVDLYHEALKLKTTGSLLGLAVGPNYVQLSKPDTSKRYSHPMITLYRRKNFGLIDQFRTYISEEKFSPSGFVIGYPFAREKGCPNAAAPVKSFVHDLIKAAKFEGVNFTFWDEVFKTKTVQPQLETIELTHREILSYVEEYAAAEILQGYLDFVIQSQDQNFSSKESE